MSAGRRQSGRQVHLARADWAGQALRALLTLGLGRSAKARLPLPFDMAVPMRIGRGCLLAALREALAGKAKRVIIPSFVCRAVAEAVLVAGGEPSFSDIADDLNADADDMERLLIRADVAAVVVPHMFGRPANLSRIETAAGSTGAWVIDNAAAALGIMYDGRLLGTWGDAGIVSFAQQKSLVCGYGGLLIANSPRMREAVARLDMPAARPFAQIAEALWWLWEFRYRYALPTLRYYASRLGQRFLGRGPRHHVRVEPLPRIYRTVAAAQCRRLGQVLERRRRNCRELRGRLVNIDGLSVPQYYDGCMLTRFFVRTPGLRWDYDEDGVRKPHPLAVHLAKRGIETGRPYYPLHLHKEFRQFADRPLPRTEEIVPEIVALPVQGKMAEWEYDAIAKGVRSFFGV